jgi:hypothetical protein
MLRLCWLESSPAPPLLSGNRLTDQRIDQIGKGAVFFPRPERQLAARFRGQPESDTLG